MSMIFKPKYKNKNGEYKQAKNYAIKFYYNGQQYIRSLGVSTFKQAKNIQNKIDYNISIGKFDPEWLNKNRDIHLYKAIEHYKNYLNSLTNKYSPKTIYSYRNSMDILKEVLPDMPVKDISKNIIRQKVEPYLYQKYADASVNHYMRDIRVFFSYLVDNGFIEDNPLSGMVKRNRRKIPRYLKKHEIQKIDEVLEHFPSHYRDIIFLALNTGLRRDELFRLRESNVDLNNNRLIFVGKGGKERVVPLSKNARKIIERRMGHKRIFYEVEHPDTLWHIWNKVAKKAGVKARFHDLRHTFAHEFLKQGNSIRSLMEIMGHEDIQTTMQYAVFTSEDIENVRLTDF